MCTFLHMKVLLSLGLQQCLETDREEEEEEEQADQELRSRLLSSLVTGTTKYKPQLTLARTVTSCLFSRTNLTDYFLLC